MLTKLQFNVLFYVGVGGTVVMLVGPSLGLELNPNPQVVAGIGAMLTFALTQKNAIVKPELKKDDVPQGENSDNSAGIEDQANEPR